ncbi:hypothetical protein H5181_06960 [Shewanella sp. SG44-2]|uniref:hypothetical protein n=1 Tax=Shewanella sp. SG44-2 TaxID=2760962 RepID=UPI0016018CBA|nr:hypothetical protein [Shewanella sp. SG44-2]MBB1426205.1 hypothetical protein [Shewanella sp. SG44-2]
MKKTASMIFGFVLIAGIGFGIYWIVSQIWGQFKLLDPKVSVGLLTAATTVIVATSTIVLGKYIERKKDIEAHYRQKKTEIYDEFLCEFFKIFHSDIDNENEEANPDLVVFLREWQRKMILWGGQDVLSKYIAWMGHLKKGNPDAKTMFMMEEFFLEIRKDLGHKNNKLVKGSFIHLILQNPELFMVMAKDNPNLTLAELGEAEIALQG